MVAKRVVVSVQDRVVLERIVRARKCERRMLERAQIVLLAADGLSALVIAARVGCSEKLVKRWRSRYQRDGLEGLKDAPRSGAPLMHGPQTRALLIAKACTRPGPTVEGARRERWTYEQLGAEVGMSSSQAHVILQRAEIKPHLTDYWVMSDFSREGFEERMGEVCGLYLEPPENVLVLSLGDGMSLLCQVVFASCGNPGRLLAEADHGVRGADDLDVVRGVLRDGECCSWASRWRRGV